MAGHSKWSKIKRKKGANDAKTGALFTKLIREITVAAKAGGGDPAGNPRLRRAMDTARSNSMPMDNIQRAIKKGTGELEGVNYEEANYEGYGPGGTAILIEALTDNKNRTVAEIRHLLSKRGGNLGENGCVAWMFDKKGVISVDKNKADEEQLMEITLDAGAEDISLNDDIWEITCESTNLDDVNQALENANINSSQAEITMVPQNTVKLNEDDAQKMLKLLESLDDNDDIQQVHSNFDIAEDIMAKINA